VGGKIQQIGIFLNKEFLAFWATYSEKILHLLKKPNCINGKGTCYGTYIISLVLWFSNKNIFSTIVIEIF
jgi:hypothetical protein